MCVFANNQRCLMVIADAKGTMNLDNLRLYKAVDSGDLKQTNSLLDDNPSALTASLSPDGDTALHIAVLAGRAKIVEELVKRLPEKDLETKNNQGSTALNSAAIGGVTKIAEYLVKKNANLLRIPNQYEYIPVVVASLYGHDDMVRYLYSVTPLEDLDPERSDNKNGAMLLTSCILDEHYGKHTRF